jgi:hypothetical protein
VNVKNNVKKKSIRVKLKCTEGKPMFCGIYDIFAAMTPDIPGREYVLH